MSASLDRPPAATGSSLSQAAYRLGRIAGRAEVAVRRVPAPRPWLVLSALVALSWVIAAVAAHLALHDGWLYYTGGDGTWYYTTAWVLGNGHLPEGVIGYTYPLLLAPLARIAGSSQLDGLKAVVVFNQVVLAPVAIVSVYGITRMFASRFYAYVVSLTWVIFPIAVIHYFLPNYHSRYVDVALPSAVGLTDTGDYPSLVLLLVAAYFVLRAVATRRDLDAVAAGLATGLALTIKPANALFLPAVVVALAIARRPRSLAVWAIALAPALIGLVVWKYRGLGYLPVFSHGDYSSPATIAPTFVGGIDLHQYLSLDWWHLHHNLDRIREHTWSQRMVYFAGLAGIVGLARRSYVAAGLATVWLASYLVLKGSSDRVDFDGGSFLTHLAAAFPAYFLLAISLPFLVPIYGRRKPPSPVGPASSRRLPKIAVSVLGAVTGIGIIVVAVLPTLDAPAAVRLPSADLYLPADGFALSASSSGNAVRLAWTRRQPSGTRASYAIFRGRTDPASCVPVAHAADNCFFTGKRIGAVDGQTTTWTDHPPPGKWTYRVALSATPFGAQGGTDYTLLSRAAGVTVPGKAH